MKRAASLPILLLLLAAFPPDIRALPRQDPVGSRVPAETGQGQIPAPAPQKKRTLRLPDWLDIGFEHRTRFENLDNRFRLTETGGDQQIPQRTRIRVAVTKILEPVSFLFEYEDARVHLNDSGSLVTNSHVNESDLLQLSAGVSLVRLTRIPSTFFIGRQSFDLGSRRLFARNRFRNTTNSFDGFRWTIGDEKDWILHTFAFRPVLRRMRQLDRSDHGALFWGTFLSTTRLLKVKSEFYYFGLHESRPQFPSLQRRLTTLGTRQFRDPKPGALSFELETAWQFGTRGALDTFAHFEHASADYSFRIPWSPILTGRYDYASGDKDPNDTGNGQFDTLFGARRFDFGPTGIYGAWYRANLSSPGVSLELKPSSKLQLSPSVRWMWLAQARDAWVGTLLRDSTGSSGTYLGSQVEMRLRYNFSGFFRPEIGYVRFFKGSFQERVKGSPTSRDSNYIYVEANFTLDHLLK